MIVDAHKDKLMTDIIHSLTAHFSETGRKLVSMGVDGLARRHPGEHPGNFGAGAMAMPESPEDAVEIVRWCGRNGVAIVPHGGRTGLVGGTVSNPGELILCSERLNRIESIDPVSRTATVQAGVTLQVLQEATQAYGLTPGIDLPSRGSATIGGMVSTNAGGILAFRNGVMRHQILGLEAVLPDGSLFSDLSRIVKTSAGPDVKHLMIGAEGAYGFVTRVVLKLEPLRAARATALVGVADAASALAVAGHFANLSNVALEAAELMWREYFHDSAASHGADIGFVEEGTEAVLLLDISAETDEAAAAALENGLEAVWETAGIKGGIVAQSLDQSRKFWMLREASDFVYRLHPSALSFDVSLPPAELDRYVADFRARLRAVDPGFGAYVFGHIADGNLHICITHSENLEEATQLAIEDAVYCGITDVGGIFRLSMASAWKNSAPM
ncbi:FAD-binding oxidoreductase [Rhizobium sp. ARZ01]|uniref:FAD-binding oxidoreductase n=1 Tax=Rhizobium sp. ARZ01 TaxID=2769313 RepID=UPI001FEE7E66|nr:FAD-binding oxidoreductase [Rhizobium sp. ARZ01]